MKCETCKHWTEGPQENFGECGKINRDPEAELLAYAIDEYECYEVTLYTSSEFFCGLWEKEEKG